MLLDGFAKDGAIHEVFGVVLGAPDLCCFVAGDLGIGVGVLDVALDAVVIHLGIVDGMDSALLPVGMHSIEHEVEGVEMVEATENVVPAEGEKTAVGFFETFVEVGESKTESDDVVVFVDYEVGKF